MATLSEIYNIANFTIGYSVCDNEHTPIIKKAIAIDGLCANKCLIEGDENMRQQEFHYLKQLANDRVKEKQNQLVNLEMIYNFSCYNEFGYTKDEIEQKISDLKRYIHIATH